MTSALRDGVGGLDQTMQLTLRILGSGDRCRK
jgi:hypothetical protein